MSCSRASVCLGGHEGLGEFLFLCDGLRIATDVAEVGL